MNRNVKKFLVGQIRDVLDGIHSGKLKVNKISSFKVQDNTSYELDFTMNGKSSSIQFKRYTCLSGVDLVLRNSTFNLSYFFSEYCDELRLVEKELTGISGSSKCT